MFVFLVYIHRKKSHIHSQYRKVASRSTCYYSENQVFGGATIRDMSLNEMCLFKNSKKFDFKSLLWMDFKSLLCMDFRIDFTVCVKLSTLYSIRPTSKSSICDTPGQLPSLVCHKNVWCFLVTYLSLICFVFWSILKSKIWKKHCREQKRDSISDTLCY